MNKLFLFIVVYAISITLFLAYLFYSHHNNIILEHINPSFSLLPPKRLHKNEQLYQYGEEQKSSEKLAQIRQNINWTDTEFNQSKTLDSTTNISFSIGQEKSYQIQQKASIEKPENHNVLSFEAVKQAEDLLTNFSHSKEQPELSQNQQNARIEKARIQNAHDFNALKQARPDVFGYPGEDEGSFNGRNSSVTNLQQNEPKSKNHLLYNLEALQQPDIVKELLVFMHVPKAAGGSFRLGLCDISTRNNNSMIWFPTCYKASSAHSSGCGPMSWGGTHCSYDEIKDCLESGKANLHYQTISTSLQGKRFLWTTVLRDPVERVISEYFWWRGRFPCPRHNPWGQELCAIAARGIEPWVRSEHNFAHNRQSRFLTMKGERAPINKEIDIMNQKPGPQWECSSFFQVYAQDYWEKRYGKRMQEGLVVDMNKDQGWLKEVLAVADEKFFFIGLQESFPMSFALYGKLLTNITGVEHKHANAPRLRMHRSRKNQQVNPAIKKLIAEKNAIDIALYEHVRTQFYEALRKHSIISPDVQ